MGAPIPPTEPAHVATARWRWDTLSRRLAIDAAARLPVSREHIRAALKRDIASVLQRRATQFHHDHTVADADGVVRLTIRGEVHRQGPHAVSVFGTVSCGPAGPAHASESADPLTGLSTREQFLHALSTWQDALALQGQPFAVVCVDLDSLSALNDGLGHAVGDLLLRWAADRVRQAAGGGLAARIGSDEFAIALPTHTVDVPARANALLDMLSTAVSLDGHLVYPSAKAGMAWATDGAVGHGEVLRDAQSALARAKAQRARTAVSFDQAMRDEQLAVLRLDRDLRHAMATDLFQLHYQPIVELSDGRILGFEALIRWPHPTRGWVPPSEFVPRAEKNGLILPVGAWVLAEACRAQARIRAAHPSLAETYVTVNLSPLQIHHGDLVAQVESALADSGLPASGLRLELTENSAMSDGEPTLMVLQALRDRGIQILIDDFGTGYSSLNYLARLPADALKVDRSFVVGLGVDARKTRVVRTIVDLAQSLGMRVVAEGIETSRQRAWLRQLGVQIGQGYLFGRPMPEADIAQRASAPPRKDGDLADGVH